MSVMIPRFLLLLFFFFFFFFEILLVIRKDSSRHAVVVFGLFVSNTGEDGQTEEEEEDDDEHEPNIVVATDVEELLAATLIMDEEDLLLFVMGHQLGFLFLFWNDQIYYDIYIEFFKVGDDPDVRYESLLYISIHLNMPPASPADLTADTGLQDGTWIMSRQHFLIQEFFVSGNSTSRTDSGSALKKVVAHGCSGMFQS